MNISEMRSDYEKPTILEKPNLRCNGGFGFGKGTLRFDQQDGEYHFGGEHNSHFIAKDEFINEVIHRNARELKLFLREENEREALYQMAKAMGKIGGSKKSEAKSTASRANGKLGGRPKKVKDA